LSVASTAKSVSITSTVVPKNGTSTAVVPSAT
jgi:hypothetical protein